jgi:tetratricopeptide (TPR) repeat protein
MVRNPANMDIDSRGRVWVTEGANYRLFQKWGKLRPEGDRIVILEDTNGDGIADKETTFYQGNEINTALGIALKSQGKPDEAAAAFEQVVAAAPNHAPEHSNLGSILFEQNKLAEAEASYRRALALDPSMLEALNNLGLVIVESGRFAESFPWFRRYAELAYGMPSNSGAPIPPHKAQHDQEQRDYLNDGKAGAAAKFHLEEGGRVTGPAVNPDSSHGDIAARWQSSTPQIAVIDNLLTDEALDKLRQYCWRSTMWTKSYANGYLGAAPEHGFACPLEAQIADELRSTYPAILGERTLFKWWGFK